MKTEPSHSFGQFIGAAVSVSRLSIFLMVNITNGNIVTILCSNGNINVNLWKLDTGKFK